MIAKQVTVDQRSLSATEAMAKKIASKIPQTNFVNSYEQGREKQYNTPFRIIKMRGMLNQNKKAYPTFQQLENASQVSQSHPNSQKQMFNQLNFEADEFRKNYTYVDKEKLFIDLQQTKQELNASKDDNNRLRTKLLQTEKEVAKYEKIVEEIQGNAYGFRVAKKGTDIQNPQILIMNLKKQLKDLQHDFKDKSKEVEQIKKNIKVTRMSEMEVERKSYYDETLRLKSLVEQAATQLQNFSNKVNSAEQMEQELTKSLKSQEKSISEVQNLRTNLQQSEEMISQLQHLYKLSQQKLQSLQQNNQTLHQQQKKLQTSNDSMKQDLKQSIKAKQQINTSLPIPKKQIRPNPIVKKFVATGNSNTLSKKHTLKSEGSEQLSINMNRTKINLNTTGQKKMTSQHIQSYAEELRYKLILRGITWLQIKQMLEGLKLQAQQLNQKVLKDDLRSILTQEPFAFEDEERIEIIVGGLDGDGEGLVDQFQEFIGQYKTFHDYPSFSLDGAEKIIADSLQVNQDRMVAYWKSNQRLNGQGMTKSDIQKFIDHMKFNWDEATTLFYYLNIFEKSQERLELIQFEHIVNPFYGDGDEEQQQHQQQLHHQQINEDSEEGLFDNQSQDYSLDENNVPKRKQPDIPQDSQQHDDQDGRQSNKYMANQQGIQEESENDDQEFNNNGNANEDDEQYEQYAEDNEEEEQEIDLDHDDHQPQKHKEDQPYEQEAQYEDEEEEETNKINFVNEGEVFGNDKKASEEEYIADDFE